MKANFPTLTIDNERVDAIVEVLSSADAAGPGRRKRNNAQRATETHNRMESPGEQSDAVLLDVATTSDLTEQLLLASQGCVELIDLKGALEGMNSHGRRLMEIDDFSTVRGREWAALFSPDDQARIREGIDGARAGLTGQFVARRPTAKGALRWWRVHVASVRGRSGAIERILCTSYDITHVKAAETELERAVEERERVATSLGRQLKAESHRLDQAQRRAAHSEKLQLLGMFVGAVVHDINNVLAVIQSAGRAIRRQEIDPPILEMLDEVDKALDRGRGLVRRLLDFGRSDVTEAEVFSPRELVERDAELLRRLAGPSARVVFEFAEDLWPILAEPSRFRSVVFNLVSNARDALSQMGSIRIAARNCFANERPKGLPKSDYVVVSVVDDGVGMSCDVLARAGQPFFTTKGPGEGTGLGLASAFEFAAGCNGRAFVESAPGAGTTVTLYLARADAHGEVPVAPGASIGPPLHGGATLLVVEDDAATRGHLSSTLRSLGYLVLEASSADHALTAILAGVSVDLIISDLHLGTESGATVVERLRRDGRPNLPVIFVTGSSGIVAPKGETVLRKPVSEAALAKVVLERLGRLPASTLREEGFRRSERVRERIRNADIRVLLDAWRAAARRKGAAPAWGDVTVDFRLVDSGFLVAVAGGKDMPSFRFARVGAALERRLGRKLEGEPVAAADEQALGSVFQAYNRCLGGMAHFDYARLAKPAGGMTLFERLVLPLSEDGLSITHLLGVATFDEIPPTNGARRMSPMLFDDPDLAAKIERLDGAKIDRLPFGVIKLDPNGLVLLCSAIEVEQSGYRKRPAIGMDFFAKVAPCMDTPEIRGRVEAARNLGAVDVEIGWIGDFDNPDSEIRIRALSASDGGIWLMLARDPV